MPAGRVTPTAAAVLLGLAEIAGLAANIPLKYRFFSDNDLTEMVSETGWRENRDVAEWRIAQSRATFVMINRRKNVLKARIIQCALTMEVLAICCMEATLVRLLI